MRSTTHEPTYLAFEVLVGARMPDGYPVTVVESPAGEGEELCLLEPDGELQDALEAVEAGVTDEDFLAELGAFLFDELFTGDVATLYRTSLGMARSQGQQLRVRLRFTPHELAALPWEYLHDLREDSFLAISPETALVRYVPVRLPVRATAVRPPLRILVVIANPSDGQPLDATQERAIIEHALAEWVEQGRVQLEILDRAVAAEISQAMRRFQPHVFHFVGHGLFRGDTAYLVLEDEDGRANLVEERSFREFFSGAKETRLAVLNACQTATISSSQPMVGLAPRLLQRQLSAVVAMQYPVPDQASLIFTREFYRSLALGYPVDAAISEARRGIFLEFGAETPTWGTPVLFMRARDGLLFRVEDTEAKQIEIPPPPEPARPPQVPGFVGRDAEMTYYAEMLESAHTALIIGMPGVGKTALAVKLTEWVADERDRVYWHSFHEGEGIDAMIWSLAGFLAWHGREDLWKLLQSTRLTGGQPPPMETLLDYLLQLVRGGGFLLCFDDFHHVDADPALGQFVQRMQEARLAGGPSIILTSRRVPDFAGLAQWAPLEGLSSGDFRQLLAIRDLHLTPQQTDELYQLTAGNAQFLTLAIDALKQAKDPELLIGRLAESADVERYLLQEVDEGLTGQERAVMTTVAVLLGYAGTRDAIETILSGGNVWRTLRRLAERHLLMVQDGVAGREYRQHDIVRAFYYDMASVRQRRTMHRRAGDYYQTEEPDLLRAGQHFERAGEQEHAALLATQDVRGLINQGQARALLSLLERFKTGRLETALGAEVNLARAQLYTMLNERQMARESYATASEEATSLPDLAASRVLKARICLGLGELLEEESPQEALDWLGQGLEAAAGKDSQVEAALHIRMGYIHWALGDYAAASQAVELGLKRLPDGPSQLRALGLQQLGSICSAQGDTRSGQEYTRRALGISEQMHDHFQMVSILVNLAIDKFTGGLWPEAISDFQQAVILAERLGNERLRTGLELNLGGVNIFTGDNEAALNHLLRSLEMARKHNDRLTEVYVQTNLAEVRLRWGEWDMAGEALSRAEELALELDARYNLPKIYRVWAELELATEHPQEALDRALQAVDLAQSLGDEEEQGIGLRVLGQALDASDQHAAALEKFEQSLALLEQDPYETARTRMRYGLALVPAGDGSQGETLLQEARGTFQRLGAKHDLAELEALAGNPPRPPLIAP